MSLVMGGRTNIIHKLGTYAFFNRWRSLSRNLFLEFIYTANCKDMLEIEAKEILECYFLHNLALYEKL